MSKLERAKRFLSRASRPGLRVLSIGLLAASAYAGQVEFNASGLFDAAPGSGQTATLGGTLLIDTTAGDITSANLTLTLNGQVQATSTLVQFNGAPLTQGVVSSGTSYYYGDFQSSGIQLDLYIDLGSNSSLMNYAGGPLCADNDVCVFSGESSYFSTLPVDAPPDPNLGSGTLSTVSGTPEPSSALLLLGGAAAVMTLAQRKRRA